MKMNGGNLTMFTYWNRIVLSFVIVICLTPYVLSDVIEEDSDSLIDSSFMELSLEELMNVSISSSASLTETSARHRPSAMTTITQKQIEESGARSLDELLEIYVPNLQIAMHLWEPQHLGLRGSISDRDDKYLLLVNGRVMNERLHYGALSERFLPLLQDIQKVEVIRGPGSVLYGPGALFMVVNIITDNADTFQGFDVTTQFGVIDEFSGIQAKFGKQFEDGSGLYIYTGIAEQQGTNPEYAEFTTGRGWTINGLGLNVTGDTPMVDNPGLSHHNGAYLGLDKIKIHGQYQKNDFTFWTRYTRGGTNYYPFVATMDSTENSPVRDQGSGSQQLTFWLSDKFRFSEQLDLDASVSYDIMDAMRTNGDKFYASRQDELHLKGIFNWRASETLSMAMGGEYSHDRFGRKSVQLYHVVPQADPWGSGVTMPQWYTDTTSILGEIQWQFAEKWRAFLGGRVDWHSYVKGKMVSPRLALIHDLTEKDTIKAIVSESVRASMAESMKKYYDEEGKKSDYEDMTNYELQWQRQQSSDLWLNLSAFYNERHVVAWDQGNSLVTSLGDMSIYGAEIEILYQTERTSIGLSHGYSQLANFKLDNASTDQFFTTEPYGYGGDLTAWHDHITKLNISHDVSDKLNVNGSAVVYWGNQGRKDYLDYTKDKQSWDYAAGISNQKIGTPSYFLNLGMTYQFREHLKLSAHAYHVLGLIEKKYNHRDYAFSGIQRSSSMVTAPSLMFSLTYQFK